MSNKQIGVLHPGAMGAAVGAAARQGGATVVWASENRSAATRRRAEKAGLTDVETIAELVRRSDFIISICPPHAAGEVAEVVAKSGFDGVYADANAISPARAPAIQETIEAPGAKFVDGGIIGVPPEESGTTRLYLCGTAVPELAECFASGPLEAVGLDSPIGTASALKMVYAAYTKGTTALLGAILAVAEHQGVRAALEHEWSLSQPHLSKGMAVDRVRKNTAKAWRFVGEMEEIAGTFAEAGLPGGFHAAAGEIYRRLACFRESDELPRLDVVIAALREPASQVQ